MAETVVDGALHESDDVRGAEAAWAAWATPPRLAMLVGAAGVALLAAGAVVPDVPYGTAFRSAVAILFPVRRLDTYQVLPYAAIPVLAAAAAGLAVRARARSAAAGLLCGVGIEACGLAFPYLGWLIAAQAGSKALLWLLPAVGAGIVLTGGALLYARAEDSERPPARQRTGLPAPAVAVSVAGSAALLAAIVLPSQPGGAGWMSLLGEPGALKWFALEPLLLALGGLAAVLGSAGRARAAAGGVLAGLGAAGGVSFGSMVLWTGAAGVGSAHAGSYAGLGGAVALLAAGAGALVSVARAPATAAAGSAAGAAMPDIDGGATRESTRLLSATAQLDGRFARQVVRDVVKDDHRAVAPSFGVSLGTVLRHCVAARGRQTARNVLLAALTLPLVIGLTHLSSGDGLLVALIVWALAWAAIFTEYWTARYRVAVRSLTGHAYAPGRATRYLTAGAGQRIAELEEAESTNVVVYSGYSPFIGSGINQARWSFAVNVARGRESFDGVRCRTQPFTVDELQAAVAAHLLELGMDLKISDRLYVDGELVRDEPRIVPDRFHRPRTRMSPRELGVLAAEGIGRRFQCVTVTGWAGELVYTLFLSFRLTGASLFADATCCLLTPPMEDHRRVDSIEPRPFVTERLRSAARAAVATVKLPLDVLNATTREGRLTWTAWRRRVGGRRAIASNPRFDYGALAGVREVAQSKRYRRYFQFADRDMYGKILDREIFDAVRAFLAEHDIDTSDFEERQAAVLNYGVMVTGGSLQTTSLAVGQDAKSSVADGLHRLANRVGSAPPKGAHP